jgi:hypothetical protein
MQFVYGHREILLDFAKLDRTSLILGNIQHGVGPLFTLYSEYPTPRLRNLQRSPLWVYNQNLADGLKRMGLKKVHAIGSPWLYSKLQSESGQSTPTSKPKYVVFPRHYSFSYLSQVTASDIKEKIKSWRTIAGSDELEICLYWSEFIDLRWHQVAREEGVNLVCAGVSSTTPVWSQSSSRLHFYQNLRGIIDSSTHCIFESFTSAMFYANDLGKNVGLFDSISANLEREREKIFQEENRWLKSNIPGIFGTCEQNLILDSITHEFLGYDELLKPEVLAMKLSVKRNFFTNQINS